MFSYCLFNSFCERKNAVIWNALWILTVFCVCARLHLFLSLTHTHSICVYVIFSLHICLLLFLYISSWVICVHFLNACSFTFALMRKRQPWKMANTLDCVKSECSKNSKLKSSTTSSSLWKLTSNKSTIVRKFVRIRCSCSLSKYTQTITTSISALFDLIYRILGKSLLGTFYFFFSFFFFSLLVGFVWFTLENVAHRIQSCCDYFDRIKWKSLFVFFFYTVLVFQSLRRIDPVFKEFKLEWIWCQCVCVHL